MREENEECHAARHGRKHPERLIPGKPKTSRRREKEACPLDDTEASQEDQSGALESAERRADNAEGCLRRIPRRYERNEESGEQDQHDHEDRSALHPDFGNGSPEQAACHR